MVFIYNAYIRDVQLPLAFGLLPLAFGFKDLVIESILNLY